MVLFGRYCLQLWTTKEDRYDLTTVEHKIHTSKGNTPIPLKMEVHYWEGLHAAINMIFCVFKALKCDLHPELRLQVPKIIPDSFGQFKNIVSTLSLCLSKPASSSYIDSNIPFRCNTSSLVATTIGPRWPIPQTQLYFAFIPLARRNKFLYLQSYRCLYR